MKPLCLTFTVMIAAAADQTWTGTISDRHCGAKHIPLAQHGKALPDRECALACAKDHNAKYVFVTGGRIYNISNQGQDIFHDVAGRTVTLTGERNGDTISIRRLFMTTKQ